MKYLICILLVTSVQAFEPPVVDTWYYQSNHSVEFWVPDKAQHFYGSQLLVEGGMHPVLAFGSGFLYEIWQEKTVGFSWKDLVADGLGVVAGEFNNRTRFILISYSTEQKTIMLIGVVRI